MTMTAAGSAWPSCPPDHLIGLAEWERLPEDTSARYELVEGVMVVSPRPLHRHQDLVHRLCHQLREQVPDDLTALPDVEVPAAHVADHARARRGEAVVAVEILSPGSGRTDRVATHAGSAALAFGPTITLPG